MCRPAFTDANSGVRADPVQKRFEEIISAADWPRFKPNPTSSSTGDSNAITSVWAKITEGQTIDPSYCFPK